MNDEFYIGWDDKAPPGVRSGVRRAVVFLLVLTVALAAMLAWSQGTIGVSVFEWGTIKSFEGTLRAEPYPHLLVPRPGARTGQSLFSTYHLVSPFKFGLDRDTATRFHGKHVSLRGTLIYRGDQTMIEVVEGSINISGSADSAVASGPNRARTDSSVAGVAAELESSMAPVRLGAQTLRGEIVDSKCFLGVMNPGALIPHRACAIRCISGGIPPVLLIRQAGGAPLCLVLVSREGRPVNRHVLDLVAEPVEITGEVERQGEMLVLRADPETYRRISR